MQRETTLKALVQQVVAAVQEQTGALGVNLHFYDADTDELSSAGSVGLPEDFQTAYGKVGRHTIAICAESMRLDCRLIIDDLATADVFTGAEDVRASIMSYGIRSAQATPMHSSFGSMLGMVTAYYGTPGPLDEALVYITDILAAQAAGLIERIQVAEALKIVARRATLGQLAIALAHEVNNPLQALTNLLALQEQQELSKETYPTLAEDAMREVRRISVLMAQMNELRPALDEDVSRTVRSFFEKAT